MSSQSLQNSSFIYFLIHHVNAYGFVDLQENKRINFCIKQTTLHPFIKMVHTFASLKLKRVKDKKNVKYFQVYHLQGSELTVINIYIIYLWFHATISTTSATLNLVFELCTNFKENLVGAMLRTTTFSSFFL